MKANVNVLAWFASATAVGLWAPALLLFLGSIKARARYQSLGLRDDVAMPSLPALAIEAIPIITVLIVVFVVIYLGIFSLARRQTKSDSPMASSEVPVLGWITASSIVVFITSLTSIGDNTPMIIPFASITMLDLIVILIGSLAATALVAFTLSERQVGRLLLGDSVTGILITGVVVLSILAASAWIQGNDQGNDIVWHCHGQPGVLLVASPPLTDNNTTYQLIHHGGGFYFLRDPNLPLGMRQVLAIPDSIVLRADYVWMPARSSC